MENRLAMEAVIALIIAINLLMEMEMPMKNELEESSMELLIFVSRKDEGICLWWNVPLVVIGRWVLIEDVRTGTHTCSD